MPSTAKLVAVTDNKVHAHLPESDETLCGLIVLESDRKRFYTGRERDMCARCVRGAVKVRQVGAGSVGLPLQEIRNL